MTKKALLFLLMLSMVFCGFAQSNSTTSRLKQEADSLFNTIGDHDSFTKKVNRDHDKFTRKVIRDYEAFRDSVTKRYAENMLKVWKTYPVQEGEKIPKIKKIPPVIYDKEKDSLYLAEQKRLEKERKLAFEKQKREEDLQKLLQKLREREEQQRLLDEANLKRQQEQQKLLEEQKRLEQEQRELAEQKRQQEEEQKRLEQQQKEEELKKLAEEKKKKEEEERLLAERERQQEEKQRLLEEEQRKQQEQQRLLEEKRRQQESEQRALEEKKRQQEEQERLLAEQKRKQEEAKSKPINVEVLVVKEDKRPQPQPPIIIHRNESVTSTSSFDYFGTPMKVRWGDIKQFKLKGTSGKDLFNAYTELTDRKYDNLIYDCLQLRKDYQLCDWAYYKLLEIVVEEACGKGSNEAVFLQGILLSQSGYKIRFGLDRSKNKLHLLIAVNTHVYQCYTLTVNGETFTIFNGTNPDSLAFCEGNYPGEQEMNLDINQLPKLNKVISENRLIENRHINPIFSAESKVNKNILDFFSCYPTSYDGKNYMTKWAYYGNTPVTPEVREFLYPQLKSKISGMSVLEAANQLLNWVQWGLKYMLDIEQWGVADRAFFAEESLYYSACDCEDRAILYSHLVRDLLGLDVALVYYPGHLYTAVHFNENIPGDYLMVNNRKFIVADPTFYGSHVGMTMSGMNNARAQTILLRK